MRILKILLRIVLRTVLVAVMAGAIGVAAVGSVYLFTFFHHSAYQVVSLFLVLIILSNVLARLVRSFILV